MSCFLWLEVLRARFGDDTGALDPDVVQVALRGRRQSSASSTPTAPARSTSRTTARCAQHTSSGVPMVYFIATRPGWYRALYPVYVTHDDPLDRRVLASVGQLIGPVDEPEPTPIVDAVERRYAVREAKVRLHQACFRGLVLR